MSFQTPKTIKEIVTNIEQRKFLLPSIQREFVWDTERIKKLFDSLMKGYPIGSFLFWELNNKDAQNYNFYEFIRNYKQKTSHNNPACIDNKEVITTILDGQQRLTSLYIGLLGKYEIKIPRKRLNPYVTKELYIDIFNLNTEEDDIKYRFEFLSEQELAEKKIIESEFWFKVGHILNFNKAFEVNKFLMNIDESKQEIASEILITLYDKINNSAPINYYLEKDNNLDKVLDIFVRVNSGGIQLSYSDLLLSTATAKWNINAREEIINFVDKINDIGAGFNFNKDVILKAGLALTDCDPRFKADNFIENSEKIESNWDSIKKAIELSVYLLSSWGMSASILTANNAIIPIAYYIHKKDVPSNFIENNLFSKDRINIKKWLSIALLKKIFSSAADNTLRQSIKIIKDNYTNEFPLNEIKQGFKHLSSSLIFTKEDIETMLDDGSFKYGSSSAYCVLALLYEDLDHTRKFEQDHIFPKSLFTVSRLKKLGIEEHKIDDYIKQSNLLPNLQLLTQYENQSKSDKGFENWLLEKGKNRESFCKYHFIPKDLDINLANFEKFYETRKEIIANELKRILEVKE